MGLTAAASLFALLVLVYWVISEIFTMLFRFVGLPEEKARFQVASLLTGCGFTTHESEMILSTKPRRRLARIVMLFGFVFNITVVSAFVNIFFSLKTSEMGNYLLAILIPFAAVALVFGLSRIRAVRNFVDKLIGKIFGRLHHDELKNSVMVVDHIGKGTIAQVMLEELPEFLDGVPLFDSKLKEEKNVLIMLVERKDGKIDVPSGRTVINVGDTITVFGDYKDICSAFNAKERFA